MPTDLSDQYNTKLSDDDETKFSTWLGESGKSGDLTNYDLRGWWKKNGASDSRGHMTDEFKKPNHPTFSDESVYQDKKNKGGKWSGNDKDGWTFTPSETNLKNQTPEELQAYFSKIEPDAKLVLPKKSKKRSEVWYENSQPSVAGEPGL